MPRLGKLLDAVLLLLLPGPTRLTRFLEFAT
jgi:hypothetical protein